MSHQLDAVKSLVASTVGGAMAGGALWWGINQGVKINGQGVLERQGGPFQSLWVAIAVGAVVGALVSAVRSAVRRRRSQRFSTFAAMTGLDYQDDASAFLDRHPGLRSMPLFADLASSRDLTAGTRDGHAFGAFELTTIHRSHDDSSDSAETRSVVVLPLAGLPAFDLHPRGFLWNVAVAAGAIEGLSFDASTVSDPALADVVRRFERAFLVVPMDPDTATLDPQRDEAVRRLMLVEVMRVLLDAPGWTVQSREGHLAMARSFGGKSAGSLAINGFSMPLSGWGRGMDRATLIDQAMAIHDALTVAARSTEPVIAAGSGHDLGVMRARLRRRAVLGGAGAILGFFGGFAVFATVMFNTKTAFGATGLWLVVGFPLAVFGGLALGIRLGLGVERLLPDPEPIFRMKSSILAGVGGILGTIAGFVLGAVVAIGSLFGLEAVGIPPGQTGFLPLLFFGSVAVGASSGLVAGFMIADRLARRRERRDRPDDLLA